VPPRWRLLFRGGVSKGLVDWIGDLIAVLRRAPRGTSITVTIDRDEDDDLDSG
jgi:hypothetical protein